MTTTSKNKKDKKTKEIKTKTRTNSVEEENTKIITTMAVNGQQETSQNIVGGKTNEINNRRNNTDSNGERIEEQHKESKDSGDNSNKNDNNGEKSKTKVNIMTPGEMNTYTFTISWRPDQKEGQDGKFIIKMLMREMVHRTPSIIFHPTNSASSPVPRDINNINNDFPTTPASFDDFFDQTTSRDRRGRQTKFNHSTRNT
jgi:hypothetical protein